MPQRTGQKADAAKFLLYRRDDTGETSTQEVTRDEWNNHLRGLLRADHAKPGSVFVGTCAWPCPRCGLELTADVDTNHARTRLVIDPRLHWCEPRGLWD